MTKENLMDVIGHRIKEYRIKNKLSQEDLALESGVSIAHIGRLERGERCPTIDTLYKIAEVLNVSIAELVDYEEIVTYKRIKKVKRINDTLNKMPYEQTENFLDTMDSILNLIEK